MAYCVLIKKCGGDKVCFVFSNEDNVEADRRLLFLQKIVELLLLLLLLWTSVAA